MPTPAREQWLHGLSDAADALAKRSPAELGEVVAELRCSVAAAADEWVARSVAAKGWSKVPTADAEEWGSGPLAVARFLATLAPHLARSMRGEPAAPQAFGTGVDGSALHRPHRLAGLCDPLLLRGIDVTLHAATNPATDRAPSGGIALVLGAGNITATPVLDALDQVFVHRRTVLLKLHPVHDALAPTFATALAPLVQRGWLRCVVGDAGLGASLGADARVAAVHLTGSDRTWSALCNDQRLAGKQLTGEVGCTTPAIVMPGEWHAKELDHVAAQLAAYCATNGGATCVAPRVVLLAREWRQHRELLDALAGAMARLPARPPFLPTTRAQFVAATGAEPPGAALPPTLLRAADATAVAAACASECFAPVLRTIAIDGTDAARFGASATAFVREHCFGALSAYVFAPPRVLARERAAIDRTIAALPHGTVAINCWTGLGYGLGTTPWGVPRTAAPAHGRGFVRDLTGLDVRRVAIRAPFRPRPLPPWLPRHRRGAATLRALSLQTLSPSLPRVAQTIWNGIASP